MEQKKTPTIVELEPGRHAICACMMSGNYPYCDGSHKGTDKKPVIRDVEEGETVALCACGGTSNPPYCDGTHKTQKDESK